jgi:hypothetical protein
MKPVSSSHIAGGTPDYYAQYSHLIPGPRNPEELSRCPRSLLLSLFGGSSNDAVLRRRRFERILEGGFVLHTDFSGKGSIETAIAMLCVDIKEMKFHIPDGWFRCWRANDTDQLCQAFA